MQRAPQAAIANIVEKMACATPTFLTQARVVEVGGGVGQRRGAGGTRDAPRSTCVRPRRDGRGGKFFTVSRSPLFGSDGTGGLLGAIRHLTLP